MFSPRVGGQTIDYLFYRLFIYLFLLAFCKHMWDDHFSQTRHTVKTGNSMLSCPAKHQPWALWLFCLLLITHSWVSSEDTATIVGLAIPVNYVAPKLSQNQCSGTMLETPHQISTKQDLFVRRDLHQDTGLFLRVSLIKESSHHLSLINKGLEACKAAVRHELW